MIKDPHNYIPLIEDFLVHRISAEKFDSEFFNKIGNDEHSYVGQEVYSDLIDELCYFVDSYVDTSKHEITEDYEIDETQLRTEIKRIYEKIILLKKV